MIIKLVLTLHSLKFRLSLLLVINCPNPLLRNYLSLNRERNICFIMDFFPTVPSFKIECVSETASPMNRKLSSFLCQNMCITPSLSNLAVIFLQKHFLGSSLAHDCPLARVSKTIRLIKSDHINCHDSVFPLHIFQISISGWRSSPCQWAMISRLSREKNASLLRTSHGIDGCWYLIFTPSHHVLENLTCTPF